MRKIFNTRRIASRFFWHWNESQVKTNSWLTTVLWYLLIFNTRWYTMVTYRTKDLLSSNYHVLSSWTNLSFLSSVCNSKKRKQRAVVSFIKCWRPNGAPEFIFTTTSLILWTLSFGIQLYPYKHAVFFEE